MTVEFTEDEKNSLLTSVAILKIVVTVGGFLTVIFFAIAAWVMVDVRDNMISNASLVTTVEIISRTVDYHIQDNERHSNSTLRSRENTQEIRDLNSRLNQLALEVTELRARHANQ